VGLWFVQKTSTLPQKALFYLLNFGEGIDEYYIYGGVPARSIKKINSEWLYFQRLSGVVH